MKNGFRMGRLLLLSLIVPLFCEAQVDSNPVVMTIAGKEIKMDEFKYMAAKNNDVDLTNKKSLNDYLDLFINFKLKVIDAEHSNFDKSKSFASEYSKYEAELTANYMSDQKGQEAVAKMIYDRGDSLLNVSYILFRFPGAVTSKDTVSIYQKAYKAYERIKRGEDFNVVAQSAVKEDSTSDGVFSETIESLLPLKGPKAFDNAAWGLEIGEVSMPIRTAAGYYLIQLNRRKPNLGIRRVAHILFRVEDNKDNTQYEEQLEQALNIRQRILSGEDFEELAKEFSQDEGSAVKGGVLPYFTQGEMISAFEETAFALNEIGEVSEPVKTAFGYHLIKLLDKKPRLTFEEEKEKILSELRKGEWNFELYESFDSRLKKEYGYTFYPEAYAQFQRICDEYFPTDEQFFKEADNLSDTLFIMNDHLFTQKEFSYYLHRNPYSTKTYSGDFMNEVYELFLRDVVTALERENLKKKHPEYGLLLQEYRDGILLFEISNARVWSHPAEEQAELEKQWVQEIRKKYPVKVNTQLLKKIKKH